VLGEVLLAGVRLSHALAAALWVGGTLTYVISSGGMGITGPWRLGMIAFRGALRLGIGVFVLSGAILSAERLGSAPLPPTYFAILVLKVALGIWMFASARQFGAQSSERPRGRAWSRPEYVVLVLGVVIYALAIALRTIYDDTIRA